MPSASSSAFAASSTSCLRLAMAMRAPWCPKLRQISLPMPVPPPVTNTTWPANRSGANGDVGASLMRRILADGACARYWLQLAGDHVELVDLGRLREQLVGPAHE